MICPELNAKQNIIRNLLALLANRKGMALYLAAKVFKITFPCNR